MWHRSSIGVRPHQSHPFRCVCLSRPSRFASDGCSTARTTSAGSCCRCFCPHPHHTQNRIPSPITATRCFVLLVLLPSSHTPPTVYPHTPPSPPRAGLCCRLWCRPSAALRPLSTSSSTGSARRTPARSPPRPVSTPASEGSTAGHPRPRPRPRPRRHAPPRRAEGSRASTEGSRRSRARAARSASPRCPAALPRRAQAAASSHHRPRTYRRWRRHRR